MKSFEITSDHIGIFNNYFGADLCDKYIKYFEDLNSKGLVKRRDEYHHNPKQKHEVDDSAIDVYSSSFYYGVDIPYISIPFNGIFWNECYSQYSKKYSVLNTLSKHSIIDMKVQKTEIGEGFHSWHVEKSSIESRNRIMAFMLYLNTIDEGGETEFLYQNKRIKAEKDKLLIWPSGYTHLHRGNPPISNSKYVITGWIELTS